MVGDKYENSDLNELWEQESDTDADLGTTPKTRAQAEVLYTFPDQIYPSPNIQMPCTREPR